MERRRPGYAPQAPTAPSAALEALAAQARASAAAPPQKVAPLCPPNMDKLVSTNSTLLDLTISGGKCEEGGIPGGILIEIYGKSGGGKTALMCEILGSIARAGGKTRVQDPEARLDKEYARIYGVHLDPRTYDRPDTVVQAFSGTRDFLAANHRKRKTDPIHGVGTDSLAALSTELEMEKGDKMGMKRAKDFSQELRLTCREIANSGNLVITTNQVRHGDYGDTTPGGNAVEFYSSLRLQVIRDYSGDVIKKVKLANIFGVARTDSSEEDDDDAIREESKPKGKKKGDGGIEKILGIRSLVKVVKSTVDDPYRIAPVYIMFGYGIDDIRANLQYVKELTGDTMYVTPSGKRFVGINQAIGAVEAGNEEAPLRKRVIGLWHEVDKHLHYARKARF